VETIPDLQIIVHTTTEVKTMALTQPENKDGLHSYRYGWLVGWLVVVKWVE